MLLDGEGHVRVTDFGLAKVNVSDSEHERTNSFIGTMEYMVSHGSFGERPLLPPGCLLLPVCLGGHSGRRRIGATEYMVRAGGESSLSVAVSGVDSLMH